MSYVADIILTTPIDDGIDDKSNHPNADKLSNYLNEHYGDALVKVDQYTGDKCRKVMQCDMYIAAINYLDVNEFVEFFKTIEWQYPESVQLFIKDEHDDAFAIYTALDNLIA